MSGEKLQQQIEKEAAEAALSAAIKTAKPALERALSNQYRAQVLPMYVDHVIAKNKQARCEALIQADKSLESMKPTLAQAWEQINCDIRVSRSPELQAIQTQHGSEVARQAAWKQRLCDNTIANDTKLSAQRDTGDIHGARQNAWQSHVAEQLKLAKDLRGLDSETATPIMEKRLLTAAAPISLNEEDRSVPLEVLMGINQSAQTVNMLNTQPENKMGLNINTVRKNSIEVQASTIAGALREATGIDTITDDTMETLLTNAEQAAYQYVQRQLYQTESFRIGQFNDLTQTSLDNPELLGKMAICRQAAVDLKNTSELIIAAENGDLSPAEQVALQLLKSDLQQKSTYLDLTLKVIDSKTQHDNSAHAIATMRERLLNGMDEFKKPPEEKIEQRKKSRKKAAEPDKLTKLQQDIKKDRVRVPGEKIDSAKDIKNRIPYSLANTSAIYVAGQAHFAQSALNLFLKMSPTERQAAVKRPAATDEPTELIETCLKQAQLAVIETHDMVSDEVRSTIIKKRLIHQSLKEDEKIAETIEQEGESNKLLQNVKKTSRSLLRKLRPSDDIRTLRSHSRESSGSIGGMAQRRAFEQALSQTDNHSSDKLEQYRIMTEGFERFSQAEVDLSQQYFIVEQITAHIKVANKVLGEQIERYSFFSEKIKDKKVNPELSTLIKNIDQAIETKQYSVAMKVFNQGTNNGTFTIKEKTGEQKTDDSTLSTINNYCSELKSLEATIERHERTLFECQESLSQLTGKPILSKEHDTPEIEAIIRQHPCGLLAYNHPDIQHRTTANNIHHRLLVKKKDDSDMVKITNHRFKTDFKPDSARGITGAIQFNQAMTGSVKEVSTLREKIDRIAEHKFSKLPPDDRETWQNQTALLARAKHDPNELAQLQSTIKAIAVKLNFSPEEKKMESQYQRLLSQLDSKHTQVNHQLMQIQKATNKNNEPCYQALSEFNQQDSQQQHDIQRIMKKTTKEYSLTSNYVSEDKALARYLSQLDKSTGGEKNNVISNPIRHQMVAAIIHETANLTDETVNQIAPRQEPLVFLSSTAKISMALDSIPDPTKVAERLAEPEPVDTKTDTAQTATKKQAADPKESTKQDPTPPKDEQSFKM